MRSSARRAAHLCDAPASVFSPEGGISLPVCVSHRNQAPAPTAYAVCDAPASVFNPIGNEKTRELSPVFLKSHIHLHWLAHR